MAEDIIRKGIIRDLPVPLTREQRSEVMDEWTAKDEQLEQLSIQRAEALARLTRQTDDCKDDIARLRAEWRSKERMVPIECYERYVDGKAELVRTDTGEVVDRRVASPAERQREFDDLEDEVSAEIEATESEAPEPDEKTSRKAKSKPAKEKAKGKR